MRAIALLIVFLVYAGNSIAGPSLSETRKIAALSKVWGFLKYYHPGVTSGKYDWDSVFLAELSILPSLKTEHDFNLHYIDLVSALGDVSGYRTQSLEYDSMYTFSNPLQWIDSSDMFSDAFRGMLYNVAAHRVAGKTHYINWSHSRKSSAKFINEKVYEELERNHASTKHLLLGLARFWNMVQYFYPYKYLTSQTWDSVLPEMIEKAYTVNSKNDSWHWVAELMAKVEDSHSDGLFGYRLPVQARIIDNKAVVVRIFNDSLAKENDLRIGDVLLSINDTTIEDHIRITRKYFSASNEATLLRKIGTWGIAYNSREATVKLDRNNNIYIRKIKLYSQAEINYRGEKTNKDSSWKILEGNIGYLRTDMLKGGQVKQVVKKLIDTKGLIIDMRMYPGWIIYPLCRQLSNRKTPFCAFVYPDISYPGTYELYKKGQCGRNQKRPYVGKIVLLINEETQSRGEFTTTALQTLPGAVCIGSQTAGTDGGVIPITFPGGKKVAITGNGIYYADMRPTQHIGIQPDIEIHPTIAGIRAGRDEILERAVKYINTGK